VAAGPGRAEDGPDGDGPAGDGPRLEALVLLGNSRWHWAELGAWEGSPRAGASDLQLPLEATSLRCFHTPAAPNPLPIPPARWRAWAAVGALPGGLDLPAPRRLTLEQVPLGGLPPWLGIDRALVGWGAWSRQARLSPATPVLVADAGTALSLTLVDGDGRFCGGRLAAGVSLQLRALAGATALLPQLDQAWWQDPIPEPWPLETGDAMVRGCLEAGAAAIAQAWRQVNGPRARGGTCQLWLTGGDGEALAPLLAAQGVDFTAAPNLALDSLAALALTGGRLKRSSGP
jgi:type III pantothenate kinase